ncbi:hypothetical protein [Bacillus sp. RK1064]|uniref:hypothetical protein n=1 Tax=Bacillus sp. RK1064 TaxID=3447561 RepID=UPI003ED8CCD5
MAEELMNKEKFETWLESKIKSCAAYKAKDDKNKAYMLGALTAMNEIKAQIEKGWFDGGRTDEGRD